MLYGLGLTKEKIWWWDEDTYGHCIFNAEDDHQAMAFATTIVHSMNKRYNRIRELRGVSIKFIHHLEKNGFGFNKRLVELRKTEPLKGYRLIREALNYFYFKRNGEKQRSSLMPSFCDYRPIRNNILPFAI